MQKLRFAYKVVPTSFYGWLIRVFRSAREIHVAAVMPNGPWYEAREGFPVQYGPDPRDVAKMYGEEPEVYEVEEIWMTDGEMDQIRAFCLEEMGCPYDLKGAVCGNLIVPLGYQNAKAWYCSELATAMMQRAGWMVGVTAAMVDPATHRKMLVEERRLRNRGCDMQGGAR